MDTTKKYTIINNGIIFDKNNELMVRYWLTDSFKKPKVTIRRAIKTDNC